MKRILMLLAVSLCFCLSAKAQVFVGGDFSYFKTRNQLEIKYRSYAPRIGYQYKNLALGIMVSYRRLIPMYNSNYSLAGDMALELVPFIRYHLINKNKLSLYLETDYSHTTHKKEHYQSITCSPGLQYQISPHCFVAARIGLIGYSNSTWYGFKGFGYSFGLSSSSLSFYFYLGKKTE